MKIGGAAFAIRPLRAADADAVDGVVARAFPTRAEAELVRALRSECAELLELVAEQGGALVGHIAFSPLVVERLASGVRPIGLAPVSVEPALHGRGAGGALIRAGLAACAARGEGLAFVLGHAGYYPRFGFEPAAPHGFRYRSADFDSHFFVRELAAGAARGGGGLVRYHPAFDRF